MASSLPRVSSEQRKDLQVYNWIMELYSWLLFVIASFISIPFIHQELLQMIMFSSDWIIKIEKGSQDV